MAENSFVYVGYERSEYAHSDDQPVCRLFDEGDIHRIEDKYGRKN